MTSFVLVHGAWGGSWGFHKLRPLLWGAGHEVFTPSLTGIGEREHLTNPDITLSTHIDDVTNLIRYEDLTDIVLLGFSYGGMVVTGAMAEVSDRVTHLVFLDALVPGDGDSVASLLGGLPPGDEERPWLIPAIPRSLATEEETAWATARRSLQPQGTFTEAVSIPVPLEDLGCSLTYIKATADPGEEPDSAFYRAAEKAEAAPTWSRHDIATNHMVPLMEPDALAALLVDLTT
ncbi:MAG: alpha/beta fold hydrolase [Actinomycetota bacterium]